MYDILYVYSTPRGTRGIMKQKYLNHKRYFSEYHESQREKPMELAHSTAFSHSAHPSTTAAGCVDTYHMVIFYTIILSKQGVC